ncbi:SRPBCC domain-containing protein [Winogradskyella sp. 3972H.M.0a.05]|uniref:SRPBCC family protein n=1 Tax=Winogradskyella sp. 3972H.M.0a.05 TaxID=2950277 RepID=UPI003397349C
MRQEDFSKSEFSHKILLHTTIKDVYQCVATAQGLESWFLGNVKFSSQNEQLSATEVPSSGTAYLWKWQKDFQIEGEIIASENDSYFEFTFGKDFTVLFSLERHESGSTILHLHQKNLNPTAENEFSFINCCVCWVFFLTNLKSVIEQNVDLRETTVLNETFVNQ